MAARKKSSQQTGILDRMSGEEAGTVLRHLLERHLDLRPEAERIAEAVMSSQSVEDVAASIADSLTSVDLDALNGRAGKHSWGYVEPSEAAVELLAEAVEEWVEDMKRHVELDMMASAQTLCAGIVA